MFMHLITAMYTNTTVKTQMRSTLITAPMISEVKKIYQNINKQTNFEYSGKLNRKYELYSLQKWSNYSRSTNIAGSKYCTYSTEQIQYFPGTEQSYLTWKTKFEINLKSTVTTHNKKIVQGQAGGIVWCKGGVGRGETWFQAVRY